MGPDKLSSTAYDDMLPPGSREYIRLYRGNHIGGKQTGPIVLLRGNLQKKSSPDVAWVSVQMGRT